MADFLKTVDVWFLIFLIVLLGGYFIFSMKNLFAGLQLTLNELKSLIKELFEDRNDHESRIVALETTCAIRTGEIGIIRQGNGRRDSDG